MLFLQPMCLAAINNGLLCIESADLVADLRAAFGSEVPTVRTEWSAEIDFERCVIHVGSSQGPASYNISPVGDLVQQIVSAGGLEQWITNTVSTE
jgi:hypothetical protein